MYENIELKIIFHISITSSRVDREYMKNRDILSWKLKDILEREPLLGRFLEHMCLKIYHFKNSDMIINAHSVEEFLEELMKDFEMLGIEEDKSRRVIW